MDRNTSADRADPRVLLLTSGYAPTIGGAESYAQTLADGLAEAGCDVTVVTDLVPGSEPREDGRRTRVFRLGEYHDLVRDPSKLAWEQLYFGVLPELERVLRQHRPDLVVANSLETTVIGRIVAEEYSIPLVGAYHEHAPEEEPFGLGRMALGYRALAPDLVLAGSRSYEARALRFLPRERVHLVHHGVDTARFRPDVDGTAVRASYRVAPDERLIVNAGRLKARKGQLELVRAFAGLEDPTTRLLIVGGISSASPEYADALEREVAALGLEGRVRIDRNVEYRRMPEVYAAADVVAQPSLSEGLGLAVLEGMAAGRAVVTTDIPGIREILTAEGIAEVVRPGEVTGLRDALRRLLDDSSHASRTAAAGRRHVEDRFSLDSMVTRSHAALLELLRGRAL